jgi:hypothetical protein
MGKPIADEVFGPFDARSGGWDGTIEWRAGQQVGVTVCREDQQDVPAMLSVARDSLDWLRAHEAEADGFVADTLLELYNDSWNDKGEELGREEFTRQIRLFHILFGGDGSMLLTYDDDMLFGGHEITSAYDPDKGWWDCQF